MCQNSSGAGGYVDGVEGGEWRLDLVGSVGLWVNIWRLDLGFEVM